MKISIRGDKITVTKAIKEYITEKLSRLDKYFEKPKEIECKVLIKVKNQDQSIEVTVPTSKFTLRAEERHQDLYAATDLVIDKLEGQIRKNKAKLEKKYRDVPKFEMNFENPPRLSLANTYFASTAFPFAANKPPVKPTASPGLSAIE